MLQALVEHYADRPNLLPATTDGYVPPSAGRGSQAGSAAALHEAVRYVSGMTDRFACRQAMMLLGWGRERLPQGVAPDQDDGMSERIVLSGGTVFDGTGAPLRPATW